LGLTTVRAGAPTAQIRPLQNEFDYYFQCPELNVYFCRWGVVRQAIRAADFPIHRGLMVPRERVTENFCGNSLVPASRGTGPAAGTWRLYFLCLFYSTCGLVFSKRRPPRRHRPSDRRYFGRISTRDAVNGFFCISTPREQQFFPAFCHGGRGES